MGRFDTIAQLVANPEFAERHTAYEVGPDLGYSIIWPIEVVDSLIMTSLQADFVAGLKPAVEFYERPDAESEEAISRPATLHELVLLTGVAENDLGSGNLRVRSLFEYVRSRLNENHAA